MKRIEHQCFLFAQRWNKSWENYCLVVSAFFEGYNSGKSLKDSANDLVEVDVGLHQLEQNYRKGLLDYDSIVRKFFNQFNSDDVRIHRSQDGTISVQASFKVPNGRKENV
jgi:hypothetical protein